MRFPHFTRPLMPSAEGRPWGYFITFARNETVTVKVLAIKAGESLSLQTHARRDEFWYVVSGIGTATIGTSAFPARPGSTFSIRANTPHRLASTTDLTILEISTGTFDENDITRLEDMYGRVQPDNAPLHNGHA